MAILLFLLLFQVLDKFLAEYMPAFEEENPASQDLFPELDEQSDVEEETVDATVHTFLRNSQPESICYDAGIDDFDEEELEGSILSQGSTADELRQELNSEVLKGCGCTQGCIRTVDIDAVYKHILDMREVTKNEKEMYIMGKI